MTLSAKPKFPIFGAGQAFNGGVLGAATIELGSSGLVGTAYGMPGFSATRIATGLYDMRFPQTAIRGAVFLTQPRVQTYPGPTGAVVNSGAPVDFAASVSKVGGESGIAYLNTYRSNTVQTGASPTYFSSLVNPPTGAAVDVFLIGSPIARY